MERLFYALHESLPSLRPKFLPEVAYHPADDAIDAANDGLPRGRRARRQPAVFYQVVDHVPRVAPPGGREPAVAPLRENRRLERVPHAWPDAVAAGRNI